MNNNLHTPGSIAWNKDLLQNGQNLTCQITNELKPNPKAFINALNTKANLLFGFGSGNSDFDSDIIEVTGNKKILTGEKGKKDLRIWKNKKLAIKIKELGQAPKSFALNDKNPIFINKEIGTLNQPKTNGVLLISNQSINPDCKTNSSKNIFSSLIIEIGKHEKINGKTGLFLLGRAITVSGINDLSTATNLALKHKNQLCWFGMYENTHHFMYLRASNRIQKLLNGN